VKIVEETQLTIRFTYKDVLIVMISLKTELKFFKLLQEEKAIDRNSMSFPEYGR